VVAAVGIALWAEWRSGRRLAVEHERGDRLLAEERANSRAQIEEERRIAREREQLAEAYAVQVVLGEVYAGERDPVYDEPVQPDGDSLRRLAVMVVNRGSYTITRVEAQFSLDGMSLISHHAYKREPGFESVPVGLRAGWGPADERAMHGVLAPWDMAIRFETDTVHVKFLKTPVSAGAVD
jgi:hypothetical protein